MSKIVVVNMSRQDGWTDTFIHAFSKHVGLTDAQRDALLGGEKVKVPKDKFEAIKSFAETYQETETETEEVEEEEETEEGEAIRIGDGHETGAEATVIDVSVAVERNRDATEAAAIVTDQTGSLLDAGYEAQGTVKITPLLSWQQMIKDAKAKGMSLASCPMPNSRLEKDEKTGKQMTMFGTGKSLVDLGNEPYDKYTFYDRKPGADKETKQQGSYYKTMWLASAPGRKLSQRIQRLNRAVELLKDAGGRAMVDKDFPELKGMSRVSIQRRAKDADQKQTYAIARLRDVVKHDRQVRAFENLPKRAGVPYVTFETETVDGKQVFVNRSEPVTVNVWTKPASAQATGEEVPADKLQSTTAGNYSLQAFWRFDLRKAIANAGGPDKVTWEHILDTSTRSKRKSKTDESNVGKDVSKDDWSKHEITNIRQLENVFSSVASFLTDKQDADVNTKRLAAIENRINEPDGSEFLIVLGDLSMALDDIWTKYENKYRELKRAQASVRSKEKPQAQAA